MQRSCLRWDELEKEPHAGLLDWHRKLINLRMHSYDLLGDWAIPLETAYSEGDRWVVIRRGRITVVCNLNESPQRVPFSPAWAGQMLLASEPGLQPQENGVELPGHSVMILQS